MPTDYSNSEPEDTAIWTPLGTPHNPTTPHSTSPFKDPLTPTLLEGKYAILRQLDNQGQQAHLYLVADRNQRQAVAKVPTAPGSCKDELLHLNEFRGKPGIIQLLDFGLHPIDYYDDQGEEQTADAAVIIIEHAGTSLQDVLDYERPAGERQSLPRNLAAATHTARALTYVHDAGIVHHDVKPSNILQTLDGSNHVLVDFGSACAENYTDPKGRILGTPYYMDPAYIIPGRSQPTNDVYAVGTILYQLLVGHTPFESATPRSPQQIFSLKASQTPELPQTTHGPPALITLTLRCLDKKPQNRPNTRELAEELEDILKNL